ncbi:MAG: hypothetical protein E7L06_06775, partial [Schaalia turicensis]|nr:hypothetical protein [Schaalia turicensis]
QSQTQNHKQAQKLATTRRNNKNNTHPTPHRQINTSFNSYLLHTRKFAVFRRKVALSSKETVKL